MMFITKLLATPANSRNGALRISAFILLVMLVVAAVASEEFLRLQNTFNLISQTAPLVLASIGQMLVILTGGLDVSNGAVISLTTTIVALPYPQIVTMVLALAVALLIGFVNGYGVTRLNVHPIVMTLSTMSFCQGLALLLRPIPGGDIPIWLTDAVNGISMGIPNSIYWIAVPAFLAYWLIHKRTFGLHLFAVGGNADNARFNGINSKNVILAAYLLSAVFAFLAGLYLAGRLSSGDAKVGNSFNLDSVTSVALGGVQLSGGVGSLFGTLIGSVLVNLIGNTMNLSNLSAFIQVSIKGGLLLLVVSLQRRKEIGL